jgi:phenylacetate-CoA ligase
MPGPFHSAEDAKLPREALQQLQQRKLRDLLALAGEKSAFYKAKFRKAGLKTSDVPGADFNALPFTTKAELIHDQQRNAPYGSNLTAPLAQYVRYHQTSGSTGRPIRWIDTADSWEWMLRNWSWIFASAGLKQSDRICFAFSFGPFLGFWTAFEAAAKFGALCLPAGGLSTTARLRFLLDNGITVLCCTPTYALRMAETAAEERVNIRLAPLRVLIVAGEPGGSVPQTRSRIEEAWDARCVDHHGMTETGPVSFECEKVRGRLHIIESEYIAESLNPETGKPVAEGELGELVLTNLGRLGNPLIRYRTGDLVRLIRPAPCKCGRNFAALEGGILGRRDDMIVVRGVNIYPSAIEEIVRGIPEIGEYRAEATSQRAMSELKIQIEVAGTAAECRAAAKKLTAALETALTLRIPVETVAPDSLPRFEMKARRWVRAT